MVWTLYVAICNLCELVGTLDGSCVCTYYGHMHYICGLIMDICTLFVVLDLVCDLFMAIDHCIVYLMFICIEICCYCATDVGFVHICDIGI